jgi:hypothetical protein
VDFLVPAGTSTRLDWIQCGFKGLGNLKNVLRICFKMCFQVFPRWWCPKWRHWVFMTRLKSKINFSLPKLMLNKIPVLTTRKRPSIHVSLSSVPISSINSYRPISIDATTQWRISVR